ncbi:MAG: hypothetical protein ABI353_09020 [Isosphaeraceae bacterium]
MSCSDARLQANPRNAQKSTGPKTEAGKLVSRLNSLTRGMRSEHGLVPPHLTDAVAKHNDMLVDAYHPVGDQQCWLLEQVADAAARLDYCQFMLRAQIDDQADRADLCWDQDRSRAAEEIAARLPKDPARTASRLRETAQGCRWILARWNALSVPLVENTPWDETQCNLAATLMGVGSDLRASYPTLNPAANPFDQTAIMCEHSDAIHNLMVEALEPRDAKERELTRLGYPLRPSKEYLRLQRSESKLRKVYNEAMHAFRQDCAERLVEPGSMTCLEPEPITCLESEPEPAPEIVPEPTATSESFNEKQFVRSKLSALIESIANDATPPALITRPLAATLPMAAPMLNRKARRAREKAARKHKAPAS